MVILSESSKNLKRKKIHQHFSPQSFSQNNETFLSSFKETQDLICLVLLVFLIDTHL